LFPNHLFDPIRPEMEQVELLLRRTATKVDEPLRSMVSPLLGGGKQLRPALVILTGRLFKAPPAPFHKLAAAVDMLHTATLIHDDLIDCSPVRRGQATLHSVWPAGAAVLAGDYLLGEATAQIAELESPRIAKAFAGILRTMCAGEIRRWIACQRGYDASRVGGADDWREEYYRDIQAKTASLFAATMEMAAVLANAGEQQVDMLRRYGQGLGMTFQIVDDILDFAGDAQNLGKPVGSDLRRSLPTLPLLCYLEMKGISGPVAAVLNGEGAEADIEAALAAVRASGAIAAALDEARSYATESQEALASFGDCRSIQILRALAASVIDREV
jgi:geranylgeranyl pyrophosphate synthase